MWVLEGVREFRIQKGEGMLTTESTEGTEWGGGEERREDSEFRSQNRGIERKRISVLECGGMI